MGEGKRGWKVGNVTGGEEDMEETGAERRGREARGKPSRFAPPLENFLAMPLHMHELVYCRW